MDQVQEVQAKIRVVKPGGRNSLSMRGSREVLWGARKTTFWRKLGWVLNRKRPENRYTVQEVQAKIRAGKPGGRNSLSMRGSREVSWGARKTTFWGKLGWVLNCKRPKNCYTVQMATTKPGTS